MQVANGGDVMDIREDTPRLKPEPKSVAKPFHSNKLLGETNVVILRPQNQTQIYIYEDSLPENLGKYPTTRCNRCKKDFAQIGPKPFKMCEHCRVQQRQRSKRWQTKTKQKEGVCTRCGVLLPLDGGKFVMCQNCRSMLRIRKANRFLEGKCVHCSGPNSDEGVYKVCRRCREKDKIRRLALEHQGLCNRCCVALPKEQKGHKICLPCRMKKKGHNTPGNGTTGDEYMPAKNVDVSQLFSDDSKSANVSALMARHVHPDKDTGRDASAGVKLGCEANGVADTKSFEEGKIAELDQISASATAGIHRYHQDLLISDSNKPIDENMVLSDTFGLHHDHSQLNQQLKQLTQYTEHASNDVNDAEDEDGEEEDDGVMEENLGSNGGDGHSSGHLRDVGGDSGSVLDDLNGLADMEMEYDIDIGDGVIRDIENITNESTISATAGTSNRVPCDEHTADDVEQETMLRHVRAVQAGLLSTTADPSEAEMAAAVEAVAAVAAVAVSCSRGRE